MIPRRGARGSATSHSPRRLFPRARTLSHSECAYFFYLYYFPFPAAIASLEARAALSERCEVLDDVGTITAYPEGMREFLRTNELMESKAFIRSFVKQIAVAPAAATIRYRSRCPGEVRGGGARRWAGGSLVRRATEFAMMI